MSFITIGKYTPINEYLLQSPLNYLQEQTFDVRLRFNQKNIMSSMYPTYWSNSLLSLSMKYHVEDHVRTGTIFEGKEDLMSDCTLGLFERQCGGSEFIYSVSGSSEVGV